MPKSLSRKDNHRRTLLRNLATSLILYEKIVTTERKAKETKAVVEHLISRARKNDLAGRRYLLGYLFDPNAAKKMYEVIVPRYQKLQSGFIESYRLERRLGDGASQMMLSLKQIQEPKEIKEKNGPSANSVEKTAKSKVRAKTRK